MKRGPKPCLVGSPLTTWKDECADQMVCLTLSEIKDEAQAMAEKKTSVQNPALPNKFGQTWWNVCKRPNSDFVSRLAQNVESQRASTPFSPQERTEFLNDHLEPGFEKVPTTPAISRTRMTQGFFGSSPPCVGEEGKKNFGLTPWLAASAHHSHSCC